MGGRRRIRPLKGATMLAVLIGTAAVTALGAAADGPDRQQVGPILIDRMEVSIDQFRAFAEATGLRTVAEREGGGFEFEAGWTRRQGWTYRAPSGEPGAGDEPAVHVTWSEAEAYCAAAGGRLPTLAEWQAAAYTEARARPTDGFARGRTYPFPVGELPDGMNNSRTGHVPVGTTRRGVNGLYDMGGNVWEWLADRRGEAALTAGGSWWYGPAQTRADSAQWKPAHFFALYIGFRCAYESDR